MSFHRLSAFVVLTAVLVYYFLIHRSYVEVIVETKYGSLKGFTTQSRDGRDYTVFRGIPYAKPPVGQLRFLPPVEFGNWGETKDAIILPPLCTQADPVWRKVLGQEDCLYLNVYTPKLPVKGGKLLPVLYWVHGGYFEFGGSDLYDPIYFMDEDFVVVTIHYRLGALGFLSTGDDVVSGNMGLKDQVMALKWVKFTIENFGGDPNQITIFGESAGGASVHFHMFSPLSKGLFQQAISQSGNSFVTWASTYKDTKAQAIRLGNFLNCTTQSTKELVNCLRQKDARKIAETQTSLYTKMFHGVEEMYTPTLERGGDTSKAFLTMDTRTLYREGKVERVPWLTGVNSEEGCWRSVPILSDMKGAEFYENWNELAPTQFIYKKDNQVSKKILEFYFGKESKPFTFDEYVRLTQLYSDRYFFSGFGESIRMHSKYAPTYGYYFSRKNPEGLGLIAATARGRLPVTLELLGAKIKTLLYSKILNWKVPDYGTCHADELMYLFSTFPLTFIGKSSPHYEFSKTMVKIWVHFAKNGFPGKVDGVEWTKVEPNQPPRYMHFGDLKKPAKMIDEPFTTRLKFWENLRLTPK